MELFTTSDFKNDFINTSFDYDSVTIETYTTNVSSSNVTALMDYYYEVDMQPKLEELIPVSIVYGLTLIVGIIGNGLVIFSVTRYEQMMTITNTFLLSLATADLLLVLICVPVKVSV